MSGSGQRSFATGLAGLFTWALAGCVTSTGDDGEDASGNFPWGDDRSTLARSQRVKEELVLGGVPSGRVREEGCFDTRYADTLEPGSVIVTLERRTRGRGNTRSGDSLAAHGT